LRVADFAEPRQRRAILCLGDRLGERGNERVLEIVAAVDARRVAYIAKMLVAAGVESQRARGRAAFLYWAYLGQPTVMDPRHSSIGASALDDIGDLFEK